MRPSLDELKLVSLALPVAGEAGAIYIFIGPPQDLSIRFLKFYLTTSHNSLNTQQIANLKLSQKIMLEVENAKDRVNNSQQNSPK